MSAMVSFTPFATTIATAFNCSSVTLLILAINSAITSSNKWLSLKISPTFINVKISTAFDLETLIITSSTAK